MTTTGSDVETLIDWLRDELKGTRYGEVGLVFTVHNNEISKVEKVDKKTIKFKSVLPKLASKTA